MGFSGPRAYAPQAGAARNARKRAIAGIRG
jgi:hypothetical protein